MSYVPNAGPTLYHYPGQASAFVEITSRGDFSNREGSSVYERHGELANVHNTISDVNTFATASFGRTFDTIESRPSAAYVSAMLGLARAELKTYLSWGPHWDGYKAPRFTGDVVKAADELLCHAAGFFVEHAIMPRELTPGPASDGSVDLEIGVMARTLLLTIYPPATTIQVTAIDGASNKDLAATIEPMALEPWLDWCIGEGDLQKSVDHNRGNSKH